jgi:hypothetical protein
MSATCFIWMLQIQFIDNLFGKTARLRVRKRDQYPSSQWGSIYSSDLDNFNASDSTFDLPYRGKSQYLLQFPFLTTFWIWVLLQFDSSGHFLSGCLTWDKSPRW